MQWSDLNITKC